MTVAEIRLGDVTDVKVDVAIMPMATVLSLVGDASMRDSDFDTHLDQIVTTARERLLNWARQLFVDDAYRSRFVDWESAAHDIVGRLRASQARHPGDPAQMLIVFHAEPGSDTERALLSVAGGFRPERGAAPVPG